MASGLSKQIRKINARMRTMAKSSQDVRPKEYDTIQATLKQLPTSQRKYNRKTKQYEFITPRRAQGETISILEQAEKIGNLLEEAYIEMGYELIYVPKLEISERVKWVKEQLKNY